MSGLTLINMKIKRANPSDFLGRVSKRAMVGDMKIVKDIYYAIIKEIIVGLREKGEQVLPDFGIFFLFLLMGRKIFNVGTRKHQVSAHRRVVKFKPSVPLRDYFREV